MTRLELGNSREEKETSCVFKGIFHSSQPLLRTDRFNSEMYSDSTRTGHYGLIHQNNNDYCYCRHGVHYGPTFQGGPGGNRPPPIRPDHPDHPASLDLREDFQLPPFPVETEDIEPGLENGERSGGGRGGGRGDGGRGGGGGRQEGEGRGGEGRGGGGGGGGIEAEAGHTHRAPQRRPVFTGQGQNAQPQPDLFSPSQTYDYNPAQWSWPMEPSGPGLRHYSPVREQCGCVGQGGGDAVGTATGTHPFNSSRHASALSLLADPEPAHRQTSYNYDPEGRRQASYGAEEQIWGQSKHRQASCSYSLRLERQTSYGPQELHRQASYSYSPEDKPIHGQTSYCPEEQVWDQSKHRQASYSPKDKPIHGQTSYVPEDKIWDQPKHRQASYSPEDKPIHGQTSYCPEEQVWDQPKHRQASYSYSTERQDWRFTAGCQHNHLDRCVPLEQGHLHSHMPNGCCGIGGSSPRPVSSQGRGDRANHQERTTRLKAGGVGDEIGEDGCNGRHVPAGSSSEGLVRKKQGLVWKNQGLLREKEGSVREKEGSVLENQNLIRENECAVHENRGSTQENQGSIREKEDSVQGKKGSVQEKEVSVREKKGSVLENQGSIREKVSVQAKKGSVLENQGSIREKEVSVRTKEGSVCEQIRQVVSDLEGVLGGLKQVHVDMKEVVQQIDRLTANIDLEEEEGSCNKSPCRGDGHLNPRDCKGGDGHPNPRDCKGGDGHPNPRDCKGGDGHPNLRDCKGVLMFNQGDQRPHYRDMDRIVKQKTTRVQVHTHWTGTGDLVHNHKTPGNHGPQCSDMDHTVIIHDPPPDPRDVPGVLVYRQKTNGDQGVSLLYRQPDHTVTIGTNSLSPVLTASVIKTNRVGVTALSPMGPLSTSKDPKQDRRGLNGHPPLPSPGRELNHVAPQTPPELEMTPSLPLPLWTQLSDPIAMVGYSVPTLRIQKSPLYPRHNGRVERLSKSPAQPTYPAHPALPVLPHLAQPPYPTHPTHPTHPALPPSDLKTPPYSMA
ncbi:uncharacterized protein LOC127910926 isoform X2 [Oncorhynchus keta]|uniref:uncharacterized protein LOC127910926 isoform X2 n=1 Tax=Oncorhynchus keta TaxID=8018 RepID=UPI00227CC793|nr:uncharacterized protein LOC127910926 isoform X2 [Oncorhynchus keta]